MKKTTLEAYSRPRANGIIALGLREDDRLIRVTLTDGNSQMLVASYNGKVVRFPEDTVRPMGRTATGVRAIKLDEDGKDRVIGMICVEEGSKDSVNQIVLLKLLKHCVLLQLDMTGWMAQLRA